MEAFGEDVELIVDGQNIPLSTFVRRVLSSTLRGLIGTLRGVERPERVELRLGPPKVKVDPVPACNGAGTRGPDSQPERRDRRGPRGSLPLLAISVLVSLLWGCGCDSHGASTGLTGGRNGPATSLVTLTVNFPPPARRLRGVTDSDQFTVDLLDSESGAPVHEPVTFDRNPPGTLQQTVDLNAPRGALRLGVSFFQDGLLVGAVSQEVDTTHPVEVTVEAQDLFRQLPGADVSAEQERPRAAGHPGGFVAVWAGHAPAGVRAEATAAAVPQAAEVFCRRYSSAGFQPQGSEFQVNTSATGNPALAVDVAADDRGSFTVVWDGFNPASNSQDIFGRRYGPNGQPLGDPFVVNSGLAGTQSQPRVAMDAAGRSVVVWTSTDAQGNSSVNGRHFDAQGAPVLGDCQVAAPAFNPVVSLIHSQGALLGWVVGYCDVNADGFLQAFAPGWTPLGRTAARQAPQGPDAWEGTRPRTLVFPHVLETSGSIPNSAFSFDTTLFVTYTARLGDEERAGVNYYRFDPTQGILETTVGGQRFAPLEIEGQTRSFLPSGGLLPGGACYSFTSESQGLRKQIVRVQDLRTGQFSRPGVAEQGVTLGFGVVVVGGAEPDAVNLQGFVVNAHTGPFDVSVFGFTPEPLTAGP